MRAICSRKRKMDAVAGCSFDNYKDLSSRISHTHRKKVIKHALRQQAKRRRKNSTASLPHIVVKSLPPPQSAKESPANASPKPATMREVLASIPGFSIKPRKRSNKKLSTAAQLEQTKEGCIDLETPDSILVNTNLRALLNKHTFSSLPPLYQYKLVQLLPVVDRPGLTGQPDSCLRLNSSGLNNEFFARACHEWRQRLSEGEFTPENQQKLKAEVEKEMSRLDPWKLKHFEPIWGDKCNINGDTSLVLPNPTRPSLKTTIKLRQTVPTPNSRYSKQTPRFTRRLRTVGAVTRAITSYREEEAANGPSSPNTQEKRSIEILESSSRKKMKSVSPPLVKVETSISSAEDEKKEDKYLVDDGSGLSSGADRNTSCLQQNHSKMEIGPEQQVQETVGNNVSDECSTDVLEHEETEGLTSSNINTIIHNFDSVSNNCSHNVSENEQKTAIAESESYSNEPSVNTSDDNTEANTNSDSGFSEKIGDNEKHSLEDSGDDTAGLVPDEVKPNSEQGDNESSQCDVQISEKNLNKKCEKQEESQERKVEAIASCLNSSYEVEEILSYSDEVANEDLREEVVKEESCLYTEVSQEKSCSSDKIVKEESGFSEEIKEESCFSDEIVKEESCLSDETMKEDSTSSDDMKDVSSVNSKIMKNSGSTDNTVEDTSVHDNVEENTSVPDDEFMKENSSMFGALVDENCILHNESVEEDASLFEMKDTVLEQIVNDEFKPSISDNVCYEDKDETCNSSEVDENTQCEALINESESCGSFESVKLPEVSDLSESVKVSDGDLSQETRDLSENVGISGIDSDSRFSFIDVVPKVQDEQDENEEEVDEDDDEDPGESLYAVAVGTNHECWDTVDSSTEKLLEEVPIVALEATPTSNPLNLPVEEDPVEDVKVIPMQEELEVRLEEGTFPIAEEALSMNWPYSLKMQTSMLSDNAEILEEEEKAAANKSPQPQFTEYSTSQGVKIELEVTLTPEAVTSADSLVTSSMGCTNQNVATSANSSASKATVATVIPPTTIVRFPPAIPTVPDMMTVTPTVTSSSSSVPVLDLNSTTPIRALSTPLPKSQSKVKTSSQASSGSGRNSRTTSNKPPPGAVNLERSYQICQAVIQNSPNRDQLRCQLKPPPSLLASNTNLNSSANFKKTDSSRLSSQFGSSAAPRSAAVSVNNKHLGGIQFPLMPRSNTVGTIKPLTIPPGSQTKVGNTRAGSFIQRQPSPPVVHVFTSSQGIPVNMAILQPGQVPIPPEIVDNPGSQTGHVGQFILVQRTGVGDQQAYFNSQKGAPPRASSAPPPNNQLNGVNHLMHGVGRGRPASVDIEAISRQVAESASNQFAEQYIIHRSNPNMQPINRTDKVGDSPSVTYGSTVSDQSCLGNGDSLTGVEQLVVNSSYSNLEGQMLQTEEEVVNNIRQSQNMSNSVAQMESNHPCNLNAMVICKKCGAFCHDDCIGASRLCITCLIR